MSTPIDSSLFADVADAIGLGNPAIVEKDYYIVQLLQLIFSLEFNYHQLVFSGGTALTKSSIKTYRMSEDVDLKLIPNQDFSELMSRNAQRTARKNIKQLVEFAIKHSGFFAIEQEAIILDEYRYFSFEIRYPQEYQQAPCLRPFIKLEFIESNFLSAPQMRSVQSIYSEVLKYEVELDGIACAAIIDTQAEKLLSMIRRTATVARNHERDDDETLIRHIYDTYHIQLTQPSDIDILSPLVSKVIEADNARYGNQHQQMVDSPICELRFGLELLVSDSKFAERYNSYVRPMVYVDAPVVWDDALAVFVKLANQVLDYIELKN